MAKRIWSLFLASLFFVACGDDGSDNFVSHDSNLESGSSSSIKDVDSKNSSDSKGSSTESGNSSDSKNPSSSADNGGLNSSSSIKLDYNEVFGTTVSLDSIYDRDADYIYKTVQIGSYIWLAENLRSKSEHSKCYNGDTDYCSDFGRLYNDPTPNCPEGFSIPTMEQWQSLLDKAGKTIHLRSKGLWESYEGGSLEGTNDLGFSILPSGVCTSDSCSDVFKKAYFLAADSAGYVVFSYDKPNAQIYEGYNPDLYYSVRCLQASQQIATMKDLPDDCKFADRFQIDEEEAYLCYTNSKWYREYNLKSWPCSYETEGREAISKDAKTLHICRGERYTPASSGDLSTKYCTASINGDTLTHEGKYPRYCNGIQWIDLSPSEYLGACKLYESTEIRNFGTRQYVCMDSSWHGLTLQDSTFGLCTRERFGELQTSTDTYVCKYHSWVKATEADKLGTCNEDNIMDVKPIGNEKYVCRNQIWERMTLLEERYGLCSKARFGEVIDSTTNFICKDYTWKTTTKDEVLGECTANNELETGRWKTKLYVCRNSQWGLASTLEDYYGICSLANEGDITKDRLYVCENKKWIETNAEQFYGPCTEKLQYTIYKEEKEMCDNGEWRKPQGDESDLRKFCTPDRELMSQYKNTIYGRAYYICTQSKWKQVSLVEYTVGLCNADSVGKTAVFKDSTYFCDGTRYWNTNMNSLFGTCTEQKEGAKKTYDDVIYICSSSQWKKLDDIQKEEDK